MNIKYSPSVNIIRDSEKELHYLVTPNAERVAQQIANDFKKGFHSFNLIGSYGTGKSSFLWALEQSLRENQAYFDLALLPAKGKVEVLNFVGVYQSIIEAFAERLEVQNKLAGNQEIFDAIFQHYEKAGKGGLLLIVVDELGKFLEFAAHHHPEKELYFIQQLAEFANEKDRNILFLSSLHQSFDAYANALAETQRKEWAKVKGRLKELTFNEPLEQLLLLASEHMQVQYGKAPAVADVDRLLSLNKQARAFSLSDDFAKQVTTGIYPLELFSAFTLTIALQRYGQNERSLFTFLESSDPIGINQWQSEKDGYYHLGKVYDYLLYNYYAFLNTKYNPHYAQWAGIRVAIERAETAINKNLPLVVELLKVIGLLDIFGSKGKRLDRDFLEKYVALTMGLKEVQPALEELERNKIIHFTKFDQSFKLFEGTDLDIEAAILQAGSKVDEVTDVVQALNEYFDFPYLTAKSVSYLKGTPRNFQFVISESPISQVPEGSIDGFINLVFNEYLSEEELLQHASQEQEAILFGYYKNVRQIRDSLFEIMKTEKVIRDNPDDRVAKKELQAILDHQGKLLNHYVLDSLYSDRVSWIFQGDVKKINTRRAFNRLLSTVCDKVYDKAPVYRNELINRQKISSMHNARKLYFEALNKHWQEANLGFEDSKFPAEKTIYLTLLQATGMHAATKTGYELGLPAKDTTFKAVWKASEAFMESAQRERKGITELMDVLGKRPYKLKGGLMDFWVPTYLFIKRGDYALYEYEKESGNWIFKPEVNYVLLYEIARNPQHYQVKAFEISGVRLRLFNKYREFLQQEKKDEPNKEAFIESIRPFLVLYRNLPTYCKKTQLLSENALALRTAIENAKDPEKVFFEDFPTALKFSIKQLLEADEAMVEFIRVLDDAVKEIRNAYAELVNRLDVFFQQEMVGEETDFSTYKKRMKKRFATIKEHQLVPRQKTFLQRLNSPLDDRDSWIASVAQAVLHMPLDQISDKDEVVLKDSLLHLVKELDNLRVLHKEQMGGNELLKFDLTTLDQGLQSRVIEVPKGKAKAVEQLAKEIRKKLNKARPVSTAVLIKLLKEEMNKK